ncbi:hypothetical protein BDN72DRAFT_846370 [Pluteus cervinus]|uniref:Uncharacterized protein n=1 Tax=Pluteus cervinus TaxID=181527 RepID=A0ACD3AGE5_9AGAR|nr:hypothetical protein BDN72DRAFT_846370 [Pluteus cervinus]
MSRNVTAHSKTHSTPTSWMIREILDTIFSFLSLFADRATLLSLALTCRTMTKAAQAALWHTMDSFTPIIPLLPLVKVDNSYKLSDALVPDGSRALQHLACTRVFVFSKIEHFMSDFTVQMAFSSILPVLFPNLSKLIIPNSVDGFTPEQRVFLHYFLASPLQDLVVGETHRSETLQAFASVLALRARDSLQSVSCTGSWNHLPRTITTLPLIHTIVLTGQLSDQNSVIADLSQCKSLRRLEICIREEIPGARNSSYPTTFFPRLENLTFSGDVTAIWCFLALLTSPYLQTLRLRPENWSEEFGVMLDCLVSLLVDCHYKERGWRSLAVLEITYDCATSLAQGFILDDKAYHNFFKGLSVLPLVSFELSLPVPLPSTVSLNFIASCFPGLHTLYLHRYQRAMAPTFDDLHSLAQTAPKLRRLGTRIRTGRINTTPRASNHLLDTLCVYDSSVEDAWYVADQLDQSFPYLRRITTTSTACKEGWNGVGLLLDLCHRSRRRF